MGLLGCFGRPRRPKLLKKPRRPTKDNVLWVRFVCVCVCVCVCAAVCCSVLQSHCNTLQHTATHCSTLQHTAAHCNTLQPSFLFVIWHIHTCDMTHSFVRHDSFTWLVHKRDMPHSYVWHTFTCATWLMHQCSMTNLYVQYASFTRATYLSFANCDMTHS